MKRFSDWVNVYIDVRDCWVGYYRGQHHHYVCLFPTVVIRWHRKKGKIDATSVIAKYPR